MAFALIHVRSLEFPYASAGRFP